MVKSQFFSATKYGAFFVFLSPHTEIISSKGYPVQEHNAVTSDGYVLKVIRIPNGRASPGTNGRPVVFLLHSLLGSSTDFVLNIPDENLDKRFILHSFMLYPQERPPEYNVSSVNVPVGLFWGLNDWIATPEDVRGLAKKLPNVVLDYQVPDPLFTHLDFSIGITARSQVYDKLLEIMGRYRDGTQSGT
ncbi:hypothetical protein HPB48_011010 [Haemaphysalis longicornis]|uniref:Partial AB-hydrolase lipase domain-containing protein n=1 Tax=Haemaphysalis longicornis TaxID=44386 RepID=A0A9J6GSH7_HAELO|nr:hypothetical protein HPB48_011010 [Haemaphysalis longicornis]